MFLTRFLSSFVSGNPPSVLRSHISVSVTLPVACFCGSGVEPDVGVDVDGVVVAACVMVTVNIPPVTGIKAISPMEVLNV